MNNRKILIPVGLTAVGAAALALLLKSKKDTPKTAAAPKAAKAAAPKNLSEGCYSFVSGFKNAATIEVKVKYDADRFDFSVVEEGFLCYTSDSHVAILYGADFNVQLEYVPYYAGDDFDKLAANLQAAHPDFTPMGKGFRYSDGDSVCVCLPVDASSYLLLSVLLAKGSELKPEELPTAPELAALVEGIEINTVEG